MCRTLQFVSGSMIIHNVDGKYYINYLKVVVLVQMVNTALFYVSSFGVDTCTDTYTYIHTHTMDKDNL